MAGAGKPRVVEAAKHIIAADKYNYSQDRGPGWLDDDFMDCSEFVLQSYRRGGYPEFPDHNSHLMAAKFPVVTDPEPGDIVYWSFGHVGIIENPEVGTFLAARGKGKKPRQGDWDWDDFKKHEKDRKFLRYEPTPKA